MVEIRLGKTKEQKRIDEQRRQALAAQQVEWVTALVTEAAALGYYVAELRPNRVALEPIGSDGPYVRVEIQSILLGAPLLGQILIKR